MKATSAESVLVRWRLGGTARRRGILMSGLVLLVAGSDNRIARRLALHWVAIGIGVGVAAGAAIDNMPGGVGGGAVIGALGAAILGPRRP